MASNVARSEEEITTILMALVAWAGNVNAAVNYLKSEKGIAISNATLKDWTVRYGDRYDKMREEYSAQLEANMAHEMRDIARLAADAQRLAIERTKQRLEADQEKDPARAAANLATVASKNADKLLALTGRPSQITESRDVNQIVAGLMARHPQIFGLSEEPQQLEAKVEDGG